MKYYIQLLILCNVCVVWGWSCTDQTNEVVPLDPRFPANVCVVEAPFTDPDCNVLPLDENETSTVNYCPGIEEAAPVVEGTQIFYPNLNRALLECPFDPVVIMVVGTVYVTNSTLLYSSARNILLTGYTLVEEVPPSNVSTLVLTNVTMVNATTNMTYINETFVEQWTYTPGYNISLQSMLVGMAAWNVEAQNVTVHLDNLQFEGCYTDKSFFRTLACPASCGPDLTYYCPGQWLPVGQYDECIGEGVRFTGQQRIAFQQVATTNNCNYNGFSYTTDQVPLQYQDGFTLELWVNPETDQQLAYTGIAGMYRQGENNEDGGWGFYYQKNGFVRWAVMGRYGVQVYCSTYITPHTFTHIAGTFDLGVVAMYVNGIQVCNVTSDVSRPWYNDEGARPFMLGASYHDTNGGFECDQIYGWQGVMDEVRLWNYARTAAEVQFTYNQQVDPISSGLVIYLRFDGGSYGNLVAGGPTGHLLQEFWDSPVPLNVVPTCFCNVNQTVCVPTEAVYTQLPDAVTQAANLSWYHFVPGDVISPNGGYGVLWLPGVTNLTGDYLNQVRTFIPGRYEEDGNSTCFIPGAVPSDLPPLGSHVWSNITEFTPGWFFNGGEAPYTGFNFVPGRFVDVYSVPTPVGYEPGDLVFEPGLYVGNDTFVPFSPASVPYTTAIVVGGGALWRCTDWIDSCIVRNLTLTNAPPPTVTELITAYGCRVSANDPEPTYLDSSQRGPCFVLRDLKQAIGGGTVSGVGCNISDADPLPYYLNYTYRNPCYIARDLFKLASGVASLKCTNGNVPTEPLEMPCLKNQNLTITDCSFFRYAGDDPLMCMHACDEYVSLEVLRSNFSEMPGGAVKATGMWNLDIRESNFCPCGGVNDCVYAHWMPISTGVWVTYNNRHCAIADLLPHTCDYQLTTELGCSNGILQCLDVAATLALGCQQVEVSSGITMFDTDCAVFAPCVCGQETINYTMPDGTIRQVTTNVGDVVVQVPFVTPLVYDLLNGSNVISIPCNIANTTQSFVYSCVDYETVPVIINNVTVNVTIEVPANCTIDVVVPVGTAQSLSCPCPNDFVPINGSIKGLTGAAAAAALGLYDQCQWNIPGGLEGEYCLDGVVQCPYAGGELGSGNPPPVPVGFCDEGVAKISCSQCSGGFFEYEGTTRPCNPGCPNVTVFTTSCACDQGTLVIPCERDVSCMSDNVCNGTLCAYIGNLTWDGVTYPCLVDINETLCVGFSFTEAPNPPDGYVGIPCDNGYVLPPPGPCSCAANVVSPGTNVTTACNATQNSSCVSVGGLGDPALQLVCSPSGQVTCRCDGLYALAANNYSIRNDTAAFVFDAPPLTLSLVFVINLVTQQLPIGVQLLRFDPQLIYDWALNVLHWYSDWFSMHELGRLSPWVTGSRFDWAHGYLWQENFFYCNSYDPGPAEGVYTNECKQFRPTENASCVVDSTYSLQQTPDYGFTRFSTITDAMQMDECRFIIVHRAVNMYTDVVVSTKDNVFLLSYDNAVVHSAGNQLRADYVTVRGMVFEHPATEGLPLLQPTPVADKNFDTAFNGVEGKEPPVNVSILNCQLYGNSARRSGAVIGQFGSYFTFKYNRVEGFAVRALWLAADYMDVSGNLFSRVAGRAARLQGFMGIRFDNNLFVNCRGIRNAPQLEIVSLEAAGSRGAIVPSGNIDRIIFANFSQEDYAEAFDTEAALGTIAPDLLGCNPWYDNSRQCYCRWNRLKFVNEDEQKNFDMVGIRIQGGNWTIDRIHDNVMSHSRIGMDFSYTPSITYNQRDLAFRLNPLMRVQDSWGLRKISSADFTFRPVGSLVTLGCYFPNCWPNATHSTIEVNPYFVWGVDYGYGFDRLNNLTDASRWGYQGELLNVTSRIARLRRDNMMLLNDTYAVGWPDPFCCAKPVVYGSGHQMGALEVVLVRIEFRFENLDPDPNAVSVKLFETPGRWVADTIRFYECDFDGRAVIGASKVSIANMFLDPKEGVYVMDSCRTYGWWNYPNNTRTGVVLSNQGVNPVVVVPDDPNYKFVSDNGAADADQLVIASESTVYYTQRSPSIEGFRILFSPPSQRGNRGIFLKNTRKNPFSSIQSVAVITNNVFRDLDGMVLTLDIPGNWDIDANYFWNCGMRQYGSVALVDLNGHPDSVGSFILTNNWVETHKKPLFPYGGGSANPQPFSAFYFHGLRFPAVYLNRNNTVLATGIPRKSPKSSGSESPKVVVDTGLFKSDGLSVFGIDGPNQNAKIVTPNDWDAEEIAQRNTDPKQVLSGTNADPRYASLPDANSYNDPNQYLTTLSDEQKVKLARDLAPNMTGYTVGMLFNIPAQVLIKNVIPGISNYSLLAVLQEDLYPYRIAAVGNGLQAAQILADGGEVEAGVYPGVWGLEYDYTGGCAPTKHRLQTSFSLCIICNDGCPVYPPPWCIIDPGNATFVPENPYYKTWLFDTLQEAVQKCRDPNRRIEVAAQSLPYTDPWVIVYSNWTIFSSGNATVQLTSSLTIAANNITIEGFSFRHNVGTGGPTVQLAGQAINITIANSTFFGGWTTQSCVQGRARTLSLLNNSFYAYASPIVVNVNSGGRGAFYFQLNYMLSVARTAVYSYNFEYNDFYRNVFLECGAQSVYPHLSCVRVINSQSTESLHFSRNTALVKRYTRVDGEPYRAAYWITNIPVGNFSVTNFSLTFNEAQGLDVGMRVTNVTNLAYLSLSSDPRATVKWINIQELNFNLDGSFHDVVWGEPMNDNLIAQNPRGTVMYYCDNDCGDSMQATYIFITFFSIGVAFFGYFIVLICCFHPNAIDSKVKYSEKLGRYIPLTDPLVAELSTKPR